jgi:hypothetical protein
MNSVSQTPTNMAPACSQITPVNEIMARVRKMCGGLDTPGARIGIPQRCNNSDEMSTPETPYGAVFQNPPPPEMRKKWKRWVMSMPSPYKSPNTVRIIMLFSSSTFINVIVFQPLSEIKRQFYAKYGLLSDDPTPQHRNLRKDFPDLFGENNENKDSNKQQDGGAPIDKMAVDEVDEAGTDTEV